MKQTVRHIHSRQIDQQGFTLVEILIAIVLLSFLMIGVFSITDNSATTIERVTREDADFAQVGTVINRLEMDFSQLYSPLYFSALQSDQADPKNPYAKTTVARNKVFPNYSETGHPVPLIEQPSPQELIFFTSSNRKKIPNSKESHFAWVYYQLRSMPTDVTEEREGEPRKGSNQLIRKIIATNPYDEDLDWDKVRAQPLLNYVKDFKILFWSAKKEKFVESLSDSENKLIIRAVQVIITRFDENNLEEEITRIFRPLWPVFNTALDKKTPTKEIPGVSNDKN